MSAGHVRANTPPGYPSCSLYIDLKFPSLFYIVRSSFPAAIEYTPLSIQRQFKSARSSYRKINWSFYLLLILITNHQQPHCLQFYTGIQIPSFIILVIKALSAVNVKHNLHIWVVRLGFFFSFYFSCSLLFDNPRVGPIK